VDERSCCPPPGLTARVDIFAFAGTTDRCVRRSAVRAGPVHWTCFVARQRSHARDTNINRVDNEKSALDDDAWNNDSLDADVQLHDDSCCTCSTHNTSCWCSLRHLLCLWTPLRATKRLPKLTSAPSGGIWSSILLRQLHVEYFHLVHRSHHRHYRPNICSAPHQLSTADE